MLRPHITAFTIESKLSSRRMIAEASFATSVPLIPIANPTSAFLRAGASFVPSPVTATTFPLSLSPVTRAYLSYGRDRARTNKFGYILSNYYSFRTVSTLTSSSFNSRFSASTLLIGQSHLIVLHFLQPTPPTL